MKRRTGKLRRALGLLSLFVCLLASLAGAAWAGRKEKKQTGGASSAIFAGTVFTGSGFALRGAEVLVTKDGASKGNENWKAVSDARGEFFLRLPPGPAKYNVSVRARGLKPQEKQVSFEADERQEQNFLLEPATGGTK
jgi:hypothetical protein